jgi:hypothetical protein
MIMLEIIFGRVPWSDKNSYYDIKIRDFFSEFLKNDVCSVYRPLLSEMLEYVYSFFLFFLSLFTLKNGKDFNKRYSIEMVETALLKISSDMNINLQQSTANSVLSENSFLDISRCIPPQPTFIPLVSPVHYDYRTPTIDYIKEEVYPIDNNFQNYQRFVFSFFF